MRAQSTPAPAHPLQSDSRATNELPRWNEKYDFLSGVSPITLHFDHGVLAGSYPPGREMTTVTFDDVSGYLGHVCLCGAGGYRAEMVQEVMLGAKPGLFETTPIDYSEFLSRLDRFKRARQ
jgi:hypothetical protein